MLFVIEEVIGRWSAGILGSVVLSAVASVVVERWFLGSEPLFRIPVTTSKRPVELLAYAVLGVAGGVAAVDLRQGHRRPAPSSQSPAALDTIFPASGCRTPHRSHRLSWRSASDGRRLRVHGPGHARPIIWQMFAALAALKILATTLSFVSGTPGGMFAPTLFIGAMLGAAVGGAEHIFLPHLTASSGTYVLVGMGFCSQDFCALR